jgi:hypothetical protein
MTKSTYEIKIDDRENTTIVRTDEDGSIWFIPVDESNADYQAYLEHEASTK